MKFNVKIIFLGGLLMYVAQWIFSMVTGMLIHEGVLDPMYRATTEFWRPELNQDPPDLAALMPRWIAIGLVIAFVMAGIYDNIRSAFNGSGVVKGMKFGLSAHTDQYGLCRCVLRCIQPAGNDLVLVVSRRNCNESRRRCCIRLVRGKICH